MINRIDKDRLLATLSEWNSILKRKVHLIACGGTAMTLLGIKPSTRDVDFMVPVLKEHTYLVRHLKEAGYQQKTGSGWSREAEIFTFDLFRENRIHTTELLASPLQPGRHRLLREFSRIYVGILNDYDLIVSKLMRGTSVDFEDCLGLAMAHRNEIDIEELTEHFHEMVSYDVAEDRIKPNMEVFLGMLRDREKS